MEDFEALKKKYEEEMMRYSADEANIDSAAQSSQAEDLANGDNSRKHRNGIYADKGNRSSAVGACFGG